MDHQSAIKHHYYFYYYLATGQIFCCSIIQVQGVSFDNYQRNVKSRVSISNFQVSAFMTKSRNFSQVSVSEVTVSTTSLTT